MTTITVAKRSAISRTTLYKVEAGDPGVTLGTYFRVLAALSLDADFGKLAQDDELGRKLQDLAIPPGPKPRKKRVLGKAEAAK